MISSLKILVVDPMHESLFPMLAEIGAEAEYAPNITRDEIRARHIGFDGLIVRSKTFIDRNLLGENPTLKFIGRAGAGIDNLDLEYLQSKAIAVMHASEGNRDAVGEYAVGALLSLMRKIPIGNRQVREMIWDREGNRGEEIMGKTVSIIGYGNMGHSFARRLSGFGCNVLAYDKYKTSYSDGYVTECSMEQLWAQTDILSVHVPLTTETRGMIDARYIKRFKKPPIIINTARGEVIVLKDIAELITRGEVRGAVLDVLENEKLSTLTDVQRRAFNSLLESSNVILTPHIAGWTYESHVKINVALVSKIRTMLQQK